MNQVREAIDYLRVHWHEYPRFMAELGEVLGADSRRGDAVVFDALLASSKEWCDLKAPSANDNYSAIRLYTSDAGYSAIFGTINAAFRDDLLVDNGKVLRSAAFLVELLNIDLFNYCRADPRVAGFEGVVYRGMAVSEQELAHFRMVAEGPIGERYISIPLAMVSTSTDRAGAMAFAEAESARRPGFRPLLWEIHVVGMESALLELFRQRFPESVVSSICAVPISELSDYSDEQEVLLRGPFFQLVRLGKERELVAGKSLQVVESLMLTANRDHFSSVLMGGRTADARRLFRILVTMNRASLCATRAEEQSLVSDVAAYRNLYHECRAQLDSLLAV